MAELSVDLVAADRKVWSGSAVRISAPSTLGQIGIMAGHTPLIATLKPGKVSVTTQDGVVFVAQVMSGFVSVDDNLVTLVAHEIIPVT